MIDSLTNVHSRYAYERRLAEEFQRWQRHSQPLSFSIWDIDLFKRINDSYGHEAGDRLLRGVVELFAQQQTGRGFPCAHRRRGIRAAATDDGARGRDRSVAEKLRRRASKPRRFVITASPCTSRCRRGSRTFAPAIRRRASTSARIARCIKRNSRAAIAASRSSPCFESAGASRSPGLSSSKPAQPARISARARAGSRHVEAPDSRIA